MENADRDVLRERLAQLEQTVAYQNRLGLGGLLLVVALLAVTWLATRPSKALVANSLELRDHTGVLRSKLAVNSDGAPVLTMYDHKGVKLLTLGQSLQNSSALTFFDQGDPRVQLTAVSKGISSLRFMDEGNETQSAIYMRPDRGMGISLASADEGLFLGLEPNGKPEFRFVDIDQAKEGRSRLTSEDLERFALPGKRKPTRTLVPSSPRPKTAEGPITPAKSDTDTAA